MLVLTLSFLLLGAHTTTTAKPVEAATTAPNTDLYSSYRCVGGNQDYLDWTPPHWSEYPAGRGDLHEHLSKENQICKFQNICLVDNSFSYFQHPAEAMAPKSMRITPDFFLYPGAHHEEMFRFHNVISSSIPANAEFLSTEKTVFFTYAVHSHNFAHLLMDELFPVLAAEDLFAIPSNNSLLLYHLTSSSAISPYNNVSHEDNIHFNYMTFAPLVLGSNSISTQALFNRNVCFKEFIVGQSNAFRDTRFDLHRGNIIRKGRDAIYRNLDIASPWYRSIHPTSLVILVLSKVNPGFQKDTLWGARMCEDVERIVHVDLNLPLIPILCVPGGSLDHKQEIAAVKACPLIIAEHGTVTIPSIYATDDTVVISVGEKKHIKCAYLNRIPYIHLLFAIIEEKEKISEVIRYGIHLAATNFNLDY